LRERFAVCYGHTPMTRNRAHLTKKILWAAQRDAYGDISEVARKKALAIADDRDVKCRFSETPCSAKDTSGGRSVRLALQPETKPLPGSILTRDYQGKQIRVLVLEDGFEWEGNFYKSLSATARAITGTRWNGKIFFGLKTKRS